jgi:hypothetical protein
MNQETWRAISSFPNYEVSSSGFVRRATSRTSGKALKILAGYRDKNGYPCVLLYKDGNSKIQKIHRLVVQAFIGEITSGMHVNHKDGIKHNNSMENLEIVTPSQNTKHAYDTLGRIGKNSNPSKGEKHHNSRFTACDVIEIRRLYNEGDTQNDIAARFNTRQSHISKIVRRESWEHVS